MKKIDVIIDTDIGDDIDDTWALVFLLACKNFNVKLISVSESDVLYKLNLVKSILTEIGYYDIPLAMGYSVFKTKNYQKEFIKEIDYKGKIYDDYIEAYNDILNKNKDIKILCLSPYTSLSKVADLLQKKNTPLIAMAGGLRTGYNGNDLPEPECNIFSNIEASKIILEKTNYTMLPVDVCKQLLINGENYQKIRNCSNKYCKTIMENYQIWDKFYDGGAAKKDITESSTIIYDFVPMLYLLFGNNFVTEKLEIYINEKGVTSEGMGKEMYVATSVKNVKEMLDFITNTLANND